MERLAKLGVRHPGLSQHSARGGEVAQQAGVAHLVLTHLVPPPRNFIVRRAFHERGERSVSRGSDAREDGMRFALAPR